MLAALKRMVDLNNMNLPHTCT